MAGDRYSLKDALFNAGKVEMLAGWMHRADPGFDAAAFQSRVMSRLPDLELKARIAWIAECLVAQLPQDFASASELICAALPAPLDPTRRDDDFGDFIVAPFGVVVEQLGLEAPDLALDLFEEITQRFSMEMSIRAFLNRWPDQVLARMEIWTEHDNYHVRRLVSEGTRPRLPWAQKIALDPTRPLPLLDRLHADPTRYVTRSVANHLNDISRIAPAEVFGRFADWRRQARQSEDELDWMQRHALRTLLKAGDDRALDVLGYRPDAQVGLVALQVARQDVVIGGAAEIKITLQAARTERVLVDYVMEFATASGRPREKVFRMKDTILPAGKAVTLGKRHVFKGDATTFTLYPGRHRLHPQVNGCRLGSVDFRLLGQGGPARTETG